MKIINFSLKDFEKNKNNKDNLSNKILYKMCQDYPLHTNPEEIRAKILLIGRVYAAAIERRKNKKNINEDFYEEVVDKFIKFNQNNNLDLKLQTLRNKEFNEDTLKDILAIHSELVGFFKKLTGLEKRSLASKYLHFHVPIFPIYDSRANATIKKIIGGSIKNPKLLGDKRYSKFCCKIIFLYNIIKQQIGENPTLRQIDTYLVNLANKNLSNQEENKYKKQEE